MNRWGRALVFGLVLAGTARAGDQTVTIELKTGERVTGKLLGFADHRYKVKIGDSTLGLREEDIRRIEFETAKPDVAPVATAARSDEEALAAAVDIIQHRDGARFDEAARLLEGIAPSSPQAETARSYRLWLQADRHTRDAKTAYDRGDWTAARVHLQSVLDTPDLGAEPRASVARRLETWGAVVKAYERAVALGKKGEDAGAALDEVLALEPNPANWFHDFADTEKRRGAGPKAGLTETLAAEDLLPKPSDLPAAFEPTERVCHGETAVGELRSHTQGNLRDALAEVSEVAHIRYTERGTLSLTVFGYATPETARARLVTFRRAAMVEGHDDGLLSESAEIFQAGRFNAAIRTFDPWHYSGAGATALAEDAWRKAVLERLERAAPGRVAAEKIGTKTPSLRLESLICPSAWLPERLAVASTDGKVIYSAEHGTLALTIGGSPTAEELAACRSAWRTDSSTLTLSTTGVVATSTVASLDRFMARELARDAHGVTRLTPELPEPPRPRLATAAEGVPSRDELPSCMTLATETRWTEHELETQTKDMLAKSPTDGPILAAINEGARDAVVIAYDMNRLVLSIRGYGSVEAAARGFANAQRAHAMYDDMREALQVGNLVAFLQDHGDPVPVYDAYRRALVARLEKVTGGSALSQSFRIALGDLIVYDTKSGRFRVPAALLPAELTGVDTYAVDDRSGLGLSHGDPNVFHYAFRTAEGAVELAGFRGGDGVQEPGAEDKGRFSPIWLFDSGRKALTIRTVGTVPETPSPG
jgi:hypothetical protein